MGRGRLRCDFWPSSKSCSRTTKPGLCPGFVGKTMRNLVPLAVSLDVIRVVLGCGLLVCVPLAVGLDVIRVVLGCGLIVCVPLAVGLDVVLCLILLEPILGH